MTGRQISLLAALAAALTWIPVEGATAQEQPANITADRQALRRAYGDEVASRVFSGALTSRRQAALVASAQRLPGFNCPQPLSIALVSVFPWPALPGRSAWIERYVVRCQPATVRNFLAVDEGGEVRFSELAPGTSNTDPLLQRDLMKGIVAASVRTRPSGCSQAPVVVNVRMVPEASPVPGRWREIWDVSQCGQMSEIRVAFAPSAGRGTNWTIERAP